MQIQVKMVMSDLYKKGSFHLQDSRGFYPNPSAPGNCCRIFFQQSKTTPTYPWNIPHSNACLWRKSFHILCLRYLGYVPFGVFWNFRRTRSSKKTSTGSGSKTLNVLGKCLMSSKQANCTKIAQPGIYPPEDLHGTESRRFGSDPFPFFLWVICRWTMLIFQGVVQNLPRFVFGSFSYHSLAFPEPPCWSSVWHRYDCSPKSIPIKHQTHLSFRYSPGCLGIVSGEALNIPIHRLFRYLKWLGFPNEPEILG